MNIIPPATVVQKSQNVKLSANAMMSATYASQATCPKTCPFRDNGCYAEWGNTGIITRRLTKSSITDPIEIAKCEAEGIRNLKGLFPLRLHVVGDSSTPKAAEIISEACEEYKQRSGQEVFTYTHARIPRKHWGNVSVLRSCTTLRQAEGAIEAGYAAAMAVSKFKSERRYYIGRGMYGIPCPKQTNKTESCNTCKLCFKDRSLHKNKNVILFEVHGAMKCKAVKQVEL